MSNRSFIACFYEIEEDDGSFTIIISPRGNDDLYEEYRHRIADDVEPNYIINYSHYTPYEGGIKIEICVAVDPMGSVPDFVKKLSAHKAFSVPREFWDYYVNGVMPKSGL